MPEKIQKITASALDYFVTMGNPDQEINLNPEDHSEYKWISKDEVLDYFDADDEECKAILHGFEVLSR